MPTILAMRMLLQAGVVVLVWASVVLEVQVEVQVEVEVGVL
jgi:hypothetical protein